MSFLRLQNSCQSSGFLDLFAFLYNRFFLLHIFFKSLLKQGRLNLEVVRRHGTYWFIMLMIFVETRFHLSFTVMFWFREKYSCVKSSRDFSMLGWSALFLMKILRFGRCLRLGEIFTSMITVLWSDMPSTTFTFFINPDLFVKTRSRILLAFPCLRVGSLTCWISPCSSTRESSLLAATVLYPLLGVT